MLLAAFEPGQEIAVANFFLAVFCLFTIALPLLLITRSGKTEANRDFIAATVNPWSQIGKEIELSTEAVTGITQALEVKPKIVVITDSNDKTISESEVFVSIEANTSEELEEASTQVLETHDEVLAA
tara:strand:+ start:513 stop:893 length:381 start_codon:yes stop_codon:yes gene_type:complete